MPQSVLFICLGNICRSPLAEAALREECKLHSVSAVVDSAGTSDWHAGQAPDDRAQAVATKNGVDIGHLRGRLVNANDFRDFDHIIALDTQNLKDLEKIKPVDGMAQLSMLTDYIHGRKGEDIDDPYYGKEDGFDVTWAEVTEAARSIVKALK
ncbi:MAG: low molecular weight protein-tyrosine-phosphatase [Parasphingorhabdus sp.]